MPADPGGGDETHLRIGFVALRDFTLLPFAGFIDVLRLATDEGDLSRQRACRWTVMSADGEPLTASCGTAVAADDRFRDPQEFDYLVLVGGLLHHGPQADAPTDRYLELAARRGVPIVALCTAVFTLLRLGLMQGRQCCVSWYHYWDLKRAFPDVVPVADRLFVVDGPRISCAGGTAAVDLAAWLVARHLGQSVADKALNILLAERARPAEAPQPHVVAERAPRDPRLTRAVNLIEQDLGRLPPIDDLAARVGVSRRQLERIFRAELGLSPWQYAMRRRLLQGHWLLTRSDRSITDIAQQCGFADASHFSRCMRRRFGATPRVLRAAAQDRAAGETTAAPAESAVARRRAG